LRVLHVIPSIGPLRGGPSVAMGTIARALRDAGIEVDVATTNDNDRELLNVPLGSAVDEGGVRYWYFGRTSHPYTTSTGLAMWLRANAGNYDIIHTHALFSFSTAVAASAARRHEVPYVVRPLGTLARYGMEQHSFLKRASWMMVERRLLKDAAAVHFTSEAEREEAERLGKWRSVVVPLGVATAEPMTRAPNTNGDVVYLFLSRIHPKKRVDLLLRAFAEIAASGGARLIIAGHGEPSYVAELQKLALDLRLQHAVMWAGHVAGRDKQDIIAASHVFVLPSINENFGIAPVEALASGLPVVLSRGVAIHREVEQYQAGLVVDDTVSSLAEALNAMREVNARTTMGTNAVRVAREKFSIEAMQRGLIDMYQNILAA
jgi:glycosyltransferase involved in cell wall biosynthesis